MRIDRGIVAIFLTAVLAMQAWTLKEVVALDARFAALEQHVQDVEKSAFHARN